MGHLCKTVQIGGHRGFGTTDNVFAFRRKSNKLKPAENTCESFAAAFDAGADFIELDIIRTKDDKLVVTHSNRLSDHIFNRPEIGFLADMTLAQVKKLKTGLAALHAVPTLAEVLVLVRDYREKTGRPLWVNVEIKDVKSSGSPKLRTGHILDLLARDLETAPLPYEAFMLSSFALSDLVHAKRIMPQIQRAQLFDVSEKSERMVYLIDDGDDSLYMHFTPENIHKAIDQAGISVVHPEIHSINAAAMEAVSKAGLAVNSWALYEKQPRNDRDALRKFYQLAVETHGLRTGLITDHVSKMAAEIIKFEA